MTMAFRKPTTSNSTSPPTSSSAGTKVEKRTPPVGRTASDRSLAWATKDKGLVCVNMMSDSHLKNAIDHLRRNIVMAKLQYGQTNLSLLSLRYLEDEANDRGLNHETSEPF